MNKKFKTFNEQAVYLREFKNIVYSPRIKDILTERSYTSFINPYKKYFATGFANEIHIYNNKVSIDEYIKIASLDDDISRILFNWISVFERKLKNLIAYNISSHMNSEGDFEAISYIKCISSYLVDKNHEILLKIGLDNPKLLYLSDKIIEANEQVLEKRNKLLEKIKKIGSCTTDGNNNITKHYQSKYKNVPFWILIHEFSLGDLQLLYNMLIKNLKIDVVKEFQFNKTNSINSQTLNSFSKTIENIRTIRNIVCHNESILSYFDSITENKNKQSIISTLKLLKNNFDNSILQNSNLVNKLEVNVTDYNKNRINRVNQFIELIK